VSRRHDLPRRAKECLCIISRRPYFSFFRALLLQIHGLTLLESNADSSASSAMAVLEAVYNQTDLSPGRHIVVPTSSVPRLLRDLHLVLPRHGSLHRETPILPLLETLGNILYTLINFS
jgi:hypothetical protein